MAAVFWFVRHGAEIHGINRKGLLIGLPSPIVVGAHKITSDFILDGECVGDVLYAFDLLEWDGEDLRTKPYQRRFVKLSSLLNRPDITHIEFVETATDPANKERLFRHLQAERKEGVVFKRLDAPYTPGRPNSGGNQLKHKFYATCSAVVAKINDKRSVELRLLNGKGWIPWATSPSRPTSKCRRWVRWSNAATCMPSGRATPCISRCIWGLGRTSNSTNASSPSSNTRAPERRTCAD